MIKELVVKNRSVRGYDNSVKISNAELLEMVDCARLTASSVNMQPLKYFIANDDISVGILHEETKLGGRLPELHLPFPGTEPVAYICICQDVELAESDTAFLKDVGIAAQTITLAAAEMGYGACMIGNFKPQVVEERLELPSNIKVKLIISLGKSIETIRIVEVGDNEDIAYYRDDDNVHYVPKRKLEDVIVNK